jgi:UPF0716 family protein affecting phage T7 exclusion
MEILQWLSALLQVVAAGFFALLPGMVFWLTVLGFYLLIQWIGSSHTIGMLRDRAWATRNSPQQISKGRG